MGMDANINGNHIRFSGILATTAIERFPEIHERICRDGYLDLDHGQVAEITAALAYKMDDIKIVSAIVEGETTLERVRMLQTGLFKLGHLIEWLGGDNQDKTLTFA